MVPHSTPEHVGRHWNRLRDRRSAVLKFSAQTVLKFSSQLQLDLHTTAQQLSVHAGFDYSLIRASGYCTIV